MIKDIMTWEKHSCGWREREGMCKSICLGNYIYLFTRSIPYKCHISKTIQEDDENEGKARSLCISLYSKKAYLFFWKR